MSLSPSLPTSFSFELLLVLNGLAGLVSVMSTFWAIRKTKAVQEAKLAESEEALFQQVLKSDDLGTLGKYLDGVLGQFLVSEYTMNPTVRRRVDEYLDRIQEFVGTADDVLTQANEPVRSIPEASRQAELPRQYVDLIDEVRTGEPWNALARLRRMLERELTQIAINSDAPVPSRASATRVLDILVAFSAFDEDDVDRLRFAIQVANRAIHGEDVSQAEAERAIREAAKALDEEE